MCKKKIIIKYFKSGVATLKILNYWSISNKKVKEVIKMIKLNKKNIKKLISEEIENNKKTVITSITMGLVFKLITKTIESINDSNEKDTMNI